MVWCKQCSKEVDAAEDEEAGYLCCPECGLQLDDLVFEEAVQFSKGAGGESVACGQYVGADGNVRGGPRFGFGGQGESQERAIYRGRQELEWMASQLRMSNRNDQIQTATGFYTLASKNGWIKGRKSQLVAAACLYIACRINRQPIMLIDISDLCQVNVFVLGSYFLHLVKSLHLEGQDIITNPVDPSLYIHRFADKLAFPRKEMEQVVQTSLRLIKSMKRDWMQTGRRPAGICGAALYLASHIHGVERTKRQVVKVVHVGVSTVAKRINEFESTNAGQLTVEEFNEHADKIDAEIQAEVARITASSEYTAEQKERMITYIHNSGGVFDGAHDPPAYTRGLQLQNKLKEEMLALPSNAADDGEESIEYVAEHRDALQKMIEHIPDALSGKVASSAAADANSEEQDFTLTAPSMPSLLASGERLAVSSDVQQIANLVIGDGGTGVFTSPSQAANHNAVAAAIAAASGTTSVVAAAEEDEEPVEESLSELGDSDVDEYIYPKEQYGPREAIWNETNKEYLEAQAAKAALAAAKAKDGTDEPPRKRGRGRPAGSKSGKREPFVPGATPEASMEAMLEQKKLSSKVNYNVLGNLFSSNDGSEAGDTVMVDASTSGGIATAAVGGGGKFGGDDGANELQTFRKQQTKAAMMREMRKRKAAEKDPNRNAAGIFDALPLATQRIGF